MADLVVQDVTKEYATRGDPLTVLRGCSLTLSSTDNLAILGPSGSGKSTLLHILGTLESPTSGRVTLGGQDPFQLDPRELARFRGERIGFVFQDHHLLAQCSVLDNVLIPMLGAGRVNSKHVDRARMLLDRVGLSHRLQHRPAELSGGERQRVSVARALMRSPQLLLADEPTGNLDRSNAQAIGDLLLELQRLESTILVIVTHSLELAARCRSQLELDDGRLVARQVA